MVGAHPALPALAQAPSWRAPAHATYDSGRAFQEGAAEAKKDKSVSQPRVEIYTKAFCGYCFRAKQLLDEKGVDYEEYDITMGGPKKAELAERKPDARTVPQIFIGGQAVGGSDDLARLEREGKLDQLLGL